MDREEARKLVRSSWRKIILDILEPAKKKINGEASYICPFCGHGKNGDGLTVNPKSTDGNGLKCFGCGFSGDIIDLYRAIENINYSDALHVLSKKTGIISNQVEYTYTEDNSLTPNDSTFTSYAQKYSCGALSGSTEKKNNVVEQKHSGGEKMSGYVKLSDYTEYYKQCQKRITEDAPRKYLFDRGISIETAISCGLGFDPKADPANAPGETDLAVNNPHGVPRIIIPTTKSHYIGRSIDANTGKDYEKMNPNRSKGAGEIGLFNIQALYSTNNKTVFVTEGVFNALSIIEAGGKAISINGTSNVKILLNQLERKPTAATLILAFDNDDAGQKATQAVSEKLTGMGIGFMIAGNDIIGKGGEEKEDANDLLRKNRKAFVSAIKKMELRTSTKPDNVSFYINNLMTSVTRLEKNINTGFENLDRLSGKIYPGLYVIAGSSSIGKTTFSAQIADQIAENGTDVLFFSLEHTKLEIISKNISRFAYKINHDTDITSLIVRENPLSERVKEIAEEYAVKIKDNLSIIEGNFDNCNTSFVAEYVRQYIKKNCTEEVRPVVFVDYLQILKPNNLRNRNVSTKEMMDIVVTELKQLSSELSIAIFVISSINRTNYLTSIDFESLKESGSIEYTADVIWGLQLQCVNDSDFIKSNSAEERRKMISSAKTSNPRKIELSCLKNRYGTANYSAYFNYYPKNDYFEPCKKKHESESEREVIKVPEFYR